MNFIAHSAQCIGFDISLAVRSTTTNLLALFIAEPLFLLVNEVTER